MKSKQASYFGWPFVSSLYLLGLGYLFYFGKIAYIFANFRYDLIFIFFSN